jgi:hypothetical protein
VWVKMASKAEHASRSKFRSQIRSYVKIFEDHRKAFIAQNNDSVEQFVPRLLENHDDLSMTLLWLLIDPITYLLDLTIPFLAWPIPTVNLEFDHRGCWKEISSSHYFYEGGESKGSYDNCTGLPPCFVG